MNAAAFLLILVTWDPSQGVWQESNEKTLTLVARFESYTACGREAQTRNNERGPGEGRTYFCPTPAEAEALARYMKLTIHERKTGL